MIAVTECFTANEYSEYKEAIIGEELPDAAVLKEGVHNGPHDGWGWTHIWEEELRTKRFYNFYKGKYTGEALQRKILEDMEKTLRYGEVDVTRNSAGEIVEYDITYNDVFIALDGKGSITTAYPNTG